MNSFTTNELINGSMAFLTYTGQSLTVGPDTVFEIANAINKALPTYPNLSNASQAQWQVVWGPALYCTTSVTANQQANLTLVAQSVSNPNDYIVATRGTVGNDSWEWADEDLAVDFEVWPTPSTPTLTPYVSSATFSALSLVLNTVPAATPPSGYSALPGAGQTLAAFLATLTNKGKINISFTGHSLGGAIAPALALWFKQAQGANSSIPQNAIFYPMPNWDANSNATISCVSLAGATPGDTAFSAYFDSKLGKNYDRIYNTNDTVPYGFAGLSQLPSLYSPSLSMTIAEQTSLKALEAKVTAAEASIKSVYTVLPNGNPFTFPLNASGTSYASEALYQHIASYEQMLNLPIAM